MEHPTGVNDNVGLLNLTRRCCYSPGPLFLEPLTLINCGVEFNMRYDALVPGTLDKVGLIIDNKNKIKMINRCDNKGHDFKV